MYLVIWHTAQKLYWGYYKEFLDNCREDLTITEEYIAANQVYVLKKENKIVAFYSFYLKQKKMESLFIDPDYIGKGLGKFLWSDLLKRAKKLTGAERIGDIRSTVFPDGQLPLMKVKVH